MHHTGFLAGVVEVVSREEFGERNTMIRVPPQAALGFNRRSVRKQQRRRCLASVRLE